MSTFSGSGKRAARRAAAKARKPKQPLVALRMDNDPGHDFGVAGLTLSIANNAFVDQLGRAKVWGCAYGTLEQSVIPYPSPTLSLIGERPKHLCAAMETMREWCGTGGPGAVKVEIVFAGAGYLLAISQDRRVLAWRTIGFGNVMRPASVNLAWSKQMDSRHPILNNLATYASRPFAPLHLHASVGSMSAPYAPQPIGSCAPILLSRIWVYRHESEIPRYSPLRKMLSGRDCQGPDADSEDVRASDKMAPSDVSKARDDALLALLPKTLLILRHREDGQKLVANVMEHGFARWQVEQAISNIRLREIVSSFPPEQQATALQALRLSYAEYASQSFLPSKIAINTVVDQIEHDLGDLLLTISNAKLPNGLDARMALLRELGFG